MSTLVNNCTFFPEEPNHTAGDPVVRPAWRTEVAPTLDGPVERLGLRGTPLVRQQWSVFLEGVEERTEFEHRIRESQQSGRACAPRYDRALDITANSGTSLTVLSPWPLAIGDFLAVPTLDGMVAREIDNAVESPAGTWTLTLDASVVALVGHLAYPLLFGTPRFEQLKSRNPDKLELEITLTEPLGTGSLANSDACTPAALTADTALSFCQNEVVVDDPVTCSGTNVASLTVEPWPQVDDYTVQTAPAATGPWTNHATGIASTLDVPRSQTVAYWRFVPQIGGTSADPSAVASTPATTIEGVMRAIQERYLAVETPGSPIVWPDRISDSASPGDYPAEGFYTDKTTPANAVAYVQAIADAFNDPASLSADTGWLAKYANDDDPTGTADIASIPTHDTSSLMVPTTASINTGNWEAKLFELAGCCCRLEHLLYSATETDTAERVGIGSAFIYEMVSESMGDGLPALGLAPKAWSGANWVSPTEVLLVQPNAYGFDDAPGANYGLADPGARAVQGTYDGTVSSSRQWGGASVTTRRARLAYDLSGSDKGTARVFLRLAGDTQLPRPVATIGSLQPWISIAPGFANDTPYLTGTESPPGFPSGFGATEVLPNIDHLPAPNYSALVALDAQWTMAEAVVFWTRSHRRSLGHWTHYS